jgi:hypothetical protein
LKLYILIFLLGILASGLIFAEGSSAFSSRTATTAEAGLHLEYGNGQMTEYAIDQRTIDRLGLFDASNNGQSTRYNVELELENEDGDWSFEVTVTVEF